MPCTDHEQITSLKNCNCKEEFITPNPCQAGYEAIGTKIKNGKRVPNCVPINAQEQIKRFSNKTELEQFIEDYGEDLPEDAIVLDQEKVVDEHEDFNFEDELNKIANKKIELASTGTARPNARSVQDGVNDSYNDYYKVRYEYTRDNTLGSSGESREFCKLMMRAKKLYRKEDLLRLTNMPVNRGWGKNGADTYSIWLFKGGGNCHHYFKRVVFKSSLRNAKNDINDSQIITDVKALSEGFTLRRNSGLVAKAPKRMKNNGFLKPR